MEKRPVTFVISNVWLLIVLKRTCSLCPVDTIDLSNNFIYLFRTPLHDNIHLELVLINAILNPGDALLRDWIVPVFEIREDYGVPV